MTLVLYEDPLSPWCWVAEQRIRAALEEVAFAYDLRLEPFPLRAEPRAPTPAERRALARAARRDVLLELAHAAGLDVARFALALASPATERRVRGAVEEALDRGVDHAPALVIGDEWLVVGTKSAQEYRGVLRRYVTAKLGIPPVRTVH